MRRSTFGGYTRAKDGCIVTFRMPDDSIKVKHFSSVVRERRRSYPRTTIFDRRPVDLLIEWADENEAKVVCISTPETILRDLQGTREQLDPDPHRKHPLDSLFLPEKSMLSGRMDLFEQSGPRR